MRGPGRPGGAAMPSALQHGEPEPSRSGRRDHFPGPLGRVLAGAVAGFAETRLLKTPGSC